MPESHLDFLLLAAGSGDVSEVEAILNKHPEIDIDSGDRCESSALHHAAEKGHIEVVKLLIKRGAIVNVTNMWEKTPLHSACNNGHELVVQHLVENGARIEATSNKKRFTPLHLAAQFDHMKIVEYLVQNGADVSAQAEVSTATLCFSFSPA